MFELLVVMMTMVVQVLATRLRDRRCRHESVVLCCFFCIKIKVHPSQIVIAINMRVNGSLVRLHARFGVFVFAWLTWLTWLVYAVYCLLNIADVANVAAYCCSIAIALAACFLLSVVIVCIFF